MDLFIDSFSDYVVPVSMLTLVSVAGFLGYLCRVLSDASIRHTYGLKLLEARKQKEIREKGAIVSELLAEWLRNEGDLDYYKLNMLSFQAFLWLPKQLSEDLSNTLSHQDGAKDVRSILKDIRTYLHNDEEDGLDAYHVIIFKDQPS